MFKNQLDDIITAGQSRETLNQRISLLKRISLCELNLGNYLAAESYLEECVSVIKNQGTILLSPGESTTDLLYDNYEILILYLMKNNVTKAIKIGENLIKEVNDQNFLCKLNFYLGVTEILRENIFDAKDFLYKTLSSKLPIVQLGMAYNNLGAACWWDRFPNYSSLTADEELEEDEEEEYSEKLYKSKMSDFSYAMDFFQTAIYKFEVLYETVVVSVPENATNIPLYQIQNIELPDSGSVRVSNLLDLINNDLLSAKDHVYFSDLLEKDELFKNPLSAIPLFNLAEMMLSTTESNDQRQQGLAYLHFAFRLLHRNLQIIKGFSEEENKVTEIERIRELYDDFAELYRSLYIRCLTIMSMIDSLEKVS